MSKEFSFDQLQTLIECVSKNQIGELLVEGGDTRVRIRGAKYFEGAPVMAGAPAPAAPAAPPAPALPATAPAASLLAAPVADTVENCALSPLVGTFYSSSSPDKDPFVKVGQQVNVGDVLFIVESMKVMNEVPADRSGIVAQILVDNGTPVEYGQPIIRFE